MDTCLKVETYLKECRLFISQCNVAAELKQRFKNTPEQYILYEDYMLLFPSSVIPNQSLINILDLDDGAEIQMMLLIQINMAILFLCVNDIVPFHVVCDKINVVGLIKKYPLKDVLFYLCELYTNPGVVSFLHVNSIKDLKIKDALLYKSGSYCLDNFWEHVTDYFYTACQVEKACIHKPYQNTPIPLWMYHLIVEDRDLPLCSLNEFVQSNEHLFIQRIRFGYNGFRDLKVANAYSPPVTNEKRRERHKEERVIEHKEEIKTPRIKKKKPIETSVRVINMCVLCASKQSCLECDIPCTDPNFTACHEDIGGGHFCKDARNVLNKLKRRDGVTQFLTIKATGQQVKGYVLTNMIFTCKGRLFNTMDAKCYCPDVLEIHEKELSVSLRLYVYDDKQYRLGTLTTSMLLFEGPLSDLKIHLDCSVLPMQMDLKDVVGTMDGVKTTFELPRENKSMLMIDGNASIYKKSSIRVYKLWESKTGEFNEPLPEREDEIKYCVTYGILENIQKKFFDSITYSFHKNDI